jgi:hypothetical protein
MTTQPHAPAAHPLVATRHRSFASLKHDREVYKLVFRWSPGSHYIGVEFAGHWVHDTINVFDYATDTVKISTWAEFREVIDEYMQGMDRDELRKRWLEK